LTNIRLIRQCELKPWIVCQHLPIDDRERTLLTACFNGASRLASYACVLLN
jgi:hypothetical protein